MSNGLAGKTDFGRLVRAAPLETVVSRGEDDVVRAFRRARELGVPLVVQGAGHSTNGQSLSRGGVLLVNRGTATPPRVGDGVVEVEGRARLGEIERVLNRAGRTIPVLPDFLDLTIGGTASVGGYGVESVERGALVDHVERLRLVLPTGRALWCSASVEPELFGFALAGLGGIGVIERLVVRTVDAPDYTTMFVYAYRSLPELVDSMAWMTEATAERPAFFKALHSRGRFVAMYGSHHGTFRAARAARSPTALGRRAPDRRWIFPRYRRIRSLAVRAWIAGFPRHARLWSDYLIDARALPSFAAAVNDQIARNCFAGCLRSVYLVAVRRQARIVGFPLEATDAMSGPLAVGVGLYSMVPDGRDNLVAHVRAASATCLAAAVELGGRPYLYGWHELGDDMRRRIYGPAWDRWCVKRREVDPDGIFQPDKLLGAG
jgi:FAD/FMN-containing dehydrogenase